MKNKKLLGTLVVLGLVVCGALLFGQQKKETRPTDDKVVKIGILQFVSHESLDQIEQGVEDGLAEAGYAGEAVELTVLNAEADQSKIQTMSKKLVTDQNDVVIGIATPAAQGLAAATKDIPIVMGAITDPVGAKLVSNLENPDGNVTGVSNQLPLKQTVDLIKEVTPNAQTIGFLYTSSEDNSISQMKAFKEYAKAAGLNVLEYAVPSTNEIKTTVNVMSGKVDAIFVGQDNTIASAFETVIAEANAVNIPVYSAVDNMVKQGSIAAVNQSQYGIGIETAKIAVQILKGKKPSDIPVNVIDTGIPTFNLKAAKELGITIPESALEGADIAVEAD